MTDQEWLDRWKREYHAPEPEGIGTEYRFLVRMIEYTIAIVFVLVLIAILSAPVRAQTVANALPQLNAQRASRGLYPLMPAADLQRQAEYESIVRAERGISGHLRGGCAPGRAEGVGQRSNPDPWGRQFLACYTSTRRYRYAGAAVAVNSRGRSYYQLILR